MTIKTDEILEYTAAAGVTIDGVIIKDGYVIATDGTWSKLDTIGTNTLYVDPDANGAYTTLSSALAAITDAAADNTYTIEVANSVVETEALVGKSYVDVIGVNNATITVTKTTGGPGVTLTDLTHTTWRNLHIVRAGQIANGEILAYAFLIDGSCDSSVRCERVVAENLCTVAGTANHLAAFVIQGTATPTLIECEGIGSSVAIYGHGMWWLENAAGVAIGCIGRGGPAAGGAANNWGIYMHSAASPTLIGCIGYGSSAGTDGYGIQIRGAAAPRLINCHGVGGDGGNNSHGLYLNDAARPLISGGIYQGGISGTGCNSLQVANYAAPEIHGASFVPRSFVHRQTITATTTFVISAAVAHQIKAVSWQVDVAGTGGATLAIGTTVGGGEIVAATPITSTGTKYPVLVDAGAEPQIAAGGTIYVTITGTGSPSVQIFISGEYAPVSCYGVNLSGPGAVRLDHCTIIGNCYSSYGVVVGTDARTANKLRITNCHIEGRADKAGAGTAIYTGAAYNPAPIYNCTLIGAATNITAAAGTANGTNVLI